MRKLTVANMFSTKEHSVENVVPNAMTIGASDRKRMVELVVEDTIAQLFSQHGSTPIGMAVTVTMRQQDGQEPELVVLATSPQFEMSDDFL